jgi:hypothetical protein
MKQLSSFAIVIVLLTTPLLLAQEKQDSIGIVNAPSKRIVQKEHPLPLSFVPQLYAPSSLHSFRPKPFTFNSTVWNDFNSPQSLMQPLWTQYQEDQKYAVWNYILGTMEAGATGYLLYEHLRKHHDLY